MAEGFHDLGRSSKEMEPMGASSKKNYPSISLDVDSFPPMKNMKLGSMGRAEIEFCIDPKYGGVKVYKMKYLGEAGTIKNKGEKTNDKPADTGSEKY